MKENPFAFTGLTDDEVLAARRKYGTNSRDTTENYFFWHMLKEIVQEPMFLLLLATSLIYFFLNETSEGFFLLGAIVIISTISVLQTARSNKALKSLKEYTQKLTSVIRNNTTVKIKSEEIVIGDIVVSEEGELITADGVILQLNDFSVNEAILTGEAFSVAKEIENPTNNKVYQGSAVVSGQCVYRVTHIGNFTKLGKIDTSLSNLKNQKSPLQIQITSFVKKMAILGFAIFLLIWGLSFYNSQNLMGSLLKGLTIAMSVLPEEIPVAFTTFMALGAYRLMKLGIVVKQMGTVETLGAATALCTDKTGTITQNKMELHKIYSYKKKSITTQDNWNTEDLFEIISFAMWASEIVPFNPMEIALHEVYQKLIIKDERPAYQMIHEYPLGGHPPMMTHIFKNKEGDRVIAVKGAPEGIVKHSKISDLEKQEILDKVDKLASEGLRVLAVGKVDWLKDEFPAHQQEFEFEFLGLLGFYDPPKDNIVHTLKQLYEAGIDIKMITGDNTLTAVSIANQIEFKNNTPPVTGRELMELDEQHFDERVLNGSIFTRVFPEVKVKIVNSLKKQHQIVGMTGDGVNDAPALKAAHIGIAMGLRGSDIAKEASSLILTDDDFGKMVDAIAMGRKIYLNLKKAIQYIISIHIPIILTVAVPLILGWVYPVIFTPVHVIFLELIMGPTCSIIYENEPLEKYSMQRAPRAMGETFLRWKELSISIFQGLAITLGCLFIYQFTVTKGYTEEGTRTLVFSTLIFSNVLLTLVNRSFYLSIISTFKYKNPWIWGIIGISVLLLILMIYEPHFSKFFKLEKVSGFELIFAFCIAFISVTWFEVYKWLLRNKRA
ncbi:cation-translocating P-type ATPase [Gillisia sp. M10.2A]|uniref:Cation-translocating P-type ATPase n=1 Tax=Gillisia lutea TaxID=2909668 RepID=A0ABS9EIN7_9FLAO|nr:cation-translocating P-type ATPase [Gillisia lutea]MCF4102722.1 cation-translocating P-type ATPase [Gillisia lutea]